jgi:hypothetical protein
MDYHELEKLTVVKLREMAKEHPELTDTTGMKKEDLISTLAGKLGIEMVEGGKAPAIAGSADRVKIKAQIRELKKQRAEALKDKSREQLRVTRKQLHRMRRKLRKAGKA